MEKINPCDVDYKSLLSVGNIRENNISDLWLSEEYNRYREEHLNSNRKNKTLQFMHSSLKKIKKFLF